MSDLRHSAVVRKPVGDAATALANGGELRVYEGPRPDPDIGTPTANLVIAWPLSTPAFKTGTDDGSTYSLELTGTNPGTIAGTAEAGGPFTAGHMAVVDSGNTILWTGTVGVLGSNSDLDLTSLTITGGQSIDLQGYVYAVPQQ